MKKLYCIGNTHFDPVWEWTWDEAMSSIRATFRSALLRMEEDPDFVYSFATPPVFEWIKETDPELFSQIAERVDEGRWELGEGWWLQPDCYGVSGETYVRQGLYGQRWLCENFGKYADTVFNIDSFGHSPMLPQILSKSGIKNYVFVRPEVRHVELTSPLFRWRSPDGSEVLTYRADDCYTKDMPARLQASEDGDADELIVYGVTDHGGAPTIAALTAIREHPSAFCSTLTRFFDDHRDCEFIEEREFITGDFGVYANLSQIKSAIKRGEYSLMNAEKAVSTAKLFCGINTAKQQARLTDAWKDVMFQTFHDIIGGACVKAAYDDAFAGLGRAFTTSQEILHFTLQRMTAKLAMLGHPWNLVIWNLNCSPYSGMIEAEVQWAHEFDWYNKAIELEDSDGRRYPCQIIRERSVIPAFRSRFVFDTEIPALGYKVLRVVQTGENLPEKPSMSENIVTDDLVVTFNDGCIAKVCDREGKVLCENLFTPAVFDDEGDTWAFNITAYEDKPQKWEHIRTELKESGCVRTVVRSEFRYGISTLALYYTIPAHGREITVRWECIWNDRFKAVKLLFDTENALHTAAVPYGSIVRGETAADIPIGKLVITDSYTLLSRDSFAYNLRGGRLGVTLLRSPIYGDLRISPIDTSDDYDIIGRGMNEGSLRILLEKATVAEAYRRSEAFENPPVVICEAYHGGAEVFDRSFILLDSEHCVLSAIKPAEDADGVVLRLVNYAGSSETAVLHLSNKVFPIELNSQEVKSVLYDGEKLTQVNLLEKAEN